MRTGAEKKMLYTSATASVRTGVKRTYEYIWYKMQRLVRDPVPSCTCIEEIRGSDAAWDCAKDRDRNADTDTPVDAKQQSALHLAELHYIVWRCS
jgi:hypothetical protein